MKARAVELREQCVIYDEIATYLGVSRTTVFRWTNPVAAEKSLAVSRAWKEAHREQVRAYDRQHKQETKEPCPWCGTARLRISEACRGCQRATDAVRRSVIEGAWADGWTGREIEEATGLCITHRVGEMRKRGWDLPHRRKGQALANVLANQHVRAARSSSLRIEARLALNRARGFKNRPGAPAAGEVMRPRRADYGMAADTREGQGTSFGWPSRRSGAHASGVLLA